jgi:RNA polymerase sigma-70 factor (ECF subfamily)
LNADDANNGPQGNGLLGNGLENDELVSLVEGIVERREQALSRLYDLTVGRVYRLAYAMTGSAEDAEEIVCDVYLQLWERATQYDAARGNVLPWLMVNCRSLALDLLRRRRAHRTRQERLCRYDNNGEKPIGAEDLLDLLQEGTVVHKALRELPEIQCRLIALAFFKDMTHSEIAATVQLPLGTVKSHIRRGLQSLRKCIELHVSD